MVDATWLRWELHKKRQEEDEEREANEAIPCEVDDSIPPLSEWRHGV